MAAQEASPTVKAGRYDKDTSKSWSLMDPVAQDSEKLQKQAPS
jgi:hypothetical protein